MRYWASLTLLVTLIFLSMPAPAFAPLPTEKTIKKNIVKAHKAAARKRWSKAIKYGKRAAAGYAEIGPKEAMPYVVLLVKLNGYYDKAGKLTTAASSLEEAYGLAEKILPDKHEAAVASRDLYYKLLISKKRFLDAIPIVLRNVSIYENDKVEDYKAPHYLTQLYSLYGLTRQFELEEKTLLNLHALNLRIFGEDEHLNKQVMLSLARNYCRQQKRPEFDELVKIHDLKYVC